MKPSIFLVTFLAASCGATQANSLQDNATPITEAVVDRSRALPQDSYACILDGGHYSFQLIQGSSYASMYDVSVIGAGMTSRNEASLLFQSSSEEIKYSFIELNSLRSFQFKNPIGTGSVQSPIVGTYDPTNNSQNITRRVRCYAAAQFKTDAVYSQLAQIPAFQELVTEVSATEDFSELLGKDGVSLSAATAFYEGRPLELKYESPDFLLFFTWSNGWGTCGVNIRLNHELSVLKEVDRIRGKLNTSCDD